MALNPPSSVNWRDQVAQRQKELGVTPTSAPGVVNPALPRKPDVKFIEPGLINDFSPRPRAPGDSRASPVIRDALYAMTPEGRAYNRGGPAPSASPAPSAPVAAPKPADAQMSRINAILDDPERKARIEAVAAQGRAQNASAKAAAPTTAAATTSATAPTASYFEGSDGRRRLVNSDGSVTGSAPTQGGVSFVSSPAAPAAAATPQNGTAAPRLSPADEFNSIREGLRRPGQYDPTRGIARARSDAFNVTNPMSKERALVDLATRLAADPNLKGRPGARNTIIANLMGQLDAGNNASLEGLRQRGQAGVSDQEFDQSLFSGEVDRRGARLRDQFLQEGDERLARLNNDEALLRTVIGGEYGLEAQRIGGRSQRDGSSGRSEQISRADEYLESAIEANPEDPVAAGLQAFERGVAAGLDVEGLPATNEAYQSVVSPLRDQFNTRSFVRDGIEALTTGNAGSETQLGYDVDVNDLEIPEDQPWMVDIVQLLTHADSQPYVTQLKGRPETARLVRPADGAPSEAQVRRLQMLQSTNMDRRGRPEQSRNGDRE